MSYLNNKELNKNIAFDVLAYSKKAREDKEQNHDVINASIGMYLEDNKLHTYSAVKKELNKIDPSILGYGTTKGNLEYLNKSINWFLKDLDKSFHISSLATPGGTGAISIAFKKYLKSELFIPNLSWSNYELIAKEYDINTKYYEMFDKGNFNINALINYAKNTEFPYILLNLPAHNPTGYSIKNSELEALFLELNKLNKKIVLLLDIAYVDYSNRDFISVLDKFQGLILVAASHSKSFAIYGIRTGLLIAISKNKEDIVEFDKASSHFARAVWSNSNSIGQNLVLNILSDDSLLNSYKSELKLVNDKLTKKLELFKTLADKYDIKYFNTDSGFFVTLILNTSLEKLNADLIYLIPVDKYFRLSLSSLTDEDLTKLMEKLHNHR